MIVPVDMGRPLEWCEASKQHPREGAAFYFCFMLMCATFVYRGFDWIYDWVLWAFVVAIPVLVYFDMRKDRVLAGAHWVQERNKWVSTYELVEIRSTTSGYNRASKLVDAHGNKLTLILRNAQENPKLWDLVYNGIVYSVASGNCDISRAARRILKV